ERTGIVTAWATRARSGTGGEIAVATPTSRPSRSSNFAVRTAPEPRCSGYALRLSRRSGWPSTSPSSVDRGRTGPLRPGADRVLVSVEEDLAVGVLTLELRDAAEDVFEGRRLVIRVNPQVDGLLGSHGCMTRSRHEAPSGMASLEGPLRIRRSRARPVGTRLRMAGHRFP